MLFYSARTQSSIDEDPPRLALNKVSKHHSFHHIGEEAARLNPRLSWCYANEDFVGRMAKIGQAVRYGQPAALRSQNVASRYANGVVIRLKHGMAAGHYMSNPIVGY